MPRRLVTPTPIPMRPYFVDATLDVDTRNYLPDYSPRQSRHPDHGPWPRRTVTLSGYRLMELPPAFHPRQAERRVKEIPSRWRLRRPCLARLSNRPKWDSAWPLESWFSDGSQGAGIRYAAEHAHARQRILPAGVRPASPEEHVRGARSWHYHLWNLLMLNGGIGLHRPAAHRVRVRGDILGEAGHCVSVREGMG